MQALLPASLFLVSACLARAVSLGRQLPSFAAPRQAAAKTLPGDRWWAIVGDRLYHEPVSALQLSTNVSEYYYARGSNGALTEELQDHRVGGDAGWHLFHFPGGAPSPAAVPQDRRSALSSLVQLRSGIVLSQSFPSYASSSEYTNPLSEAGRKLEKTAVGKIHGSAVLTELTKLTQLPSRSYTDPTASLSARELVKGELDAIGFKTCLHTAGNNLANVVAYVPGATDSRGSVTVGAHYDSRPFSGAAPGAEDNGSGIAALIAMARAFADSKVKPVKPLYFVGFAGEEGGMIGSAGFAADLVAGGGGIPSDCFAPKKSSSFLQEAVRASDHEAIIMDEIGWLSPKMNATLNLESFDWSKNVLDHLADASRTHNGDALTIVHNSNPFGSDHMSWLDRKMPAVLLINGDDEAYPDYHKSTDTIDHVSTDFVAQIAKAALGGAMRLAGVREATAAP